MLRTAVLSILAAIAAPALAADPWADHIVQYTPGVGAAAGLDHPATALGEPSRFTADPQFPSVVSPFSPAYLPDQIVSIGAGGSLTVSFDEPITDDAAHPFGIDLLIFGNAGYIDTDYPHGVAGPLLGAGNGTVEVSADGSHWVVVNAAHADAAFPTLGYLDLADPYAPAPGSALSDFTRPVDPAFNPAGLGFQQILAGYAGSGGGTGVDIGATGLSSISYVRISNPAASGTVEIDALAAVPSPGAAPMLALGGLGLVRRRRAR